jgi:hypothetical protein
VLVSSVSTCCRVSTNQTSVRFLTGGSRVTKRGTVLQSRIRELMLPSVLSSRAPVILVLEPTGGEAGHGFLADPNFFAAFDLLRLRSSFLLFRSSATRRNPASAVTASWAERESIKSVGFVAEAESAKGPVFHKSIHRYFVITPIIALTSMKQLFSFARVDG